MKTCETCYYQHAGHDGRACVDCAASPGGQLPRWRALPRSFRPSKPDADPTAKHDQGKARWDLLPWPVLEGVVTILTTGAPSHGERGWRTLPGARDRYFSAMMRHAMAWLKGETHDVESGLHPLVHVAANALILADLAGAGRPPGDNSADVSTVGAARDGGP